ncbi:MAG: class I SAM-dependent methyltransferase [Alphaproteobacteria bacterium]|nr:class I SAM-dependent methyltransferase [Alphaproteobacteria bacterium]
MSPRTHQLDDRLHAYLLAHGVREPAVAARLRERTQAHPKAAMQISAEQGQLLAFLVETLQARRVLEVGTFTGYSALRMALALPEGGELVCCDVSEAWTAIAREAWAEAGVADRVTLHLAPATETLARLRSEGAEGTFDLAFIDADKEGYGAYVDACHALLRPGGLVAIDNVFWSGAVADPTRDDPDTRALKALNATLVADERWGLAMLPIGDGCTLLRRR